MTPTATTGKILFIFCFMKTIREFVLTVTPNSNSTTEQPSNNMVNQSSDTMYHLMTLITFPADITCDITKVCKQLIHTVLELHMYYADS